MIKIADKFSNAPSFLIWGFRVQVTVGPLPSRKNPTLFSQVYRRPKRFRAALLADMRRLETHRNANSGTVGSDIFGQCLKVGVR